MRAAPRFFFPGSVMFRLQFVNPFAAFLLLAPTTVAAQSPARRPSLVVFITIDQMRADYFTRFGAQLTGGLKRLHDGASFARGFHDHAITETAPGHATTMSGRYPVHTGIVMNSQGVNTRDAPLIGASDAGASPFRFVGTTLTDWMRAVDPSTRVLSVSRKDRGAILPIGRTKTDVYWYAPSNGTFTTSRYYADTLPSWVQRFNAKKIPQSFAGKSWTPMKDASAYPEPDSVAIESLGVDYAFPHVLPSDPAAAARGIAEYPWMDEMTIDFALQGMRELGIGDGGSRTDLMAISLSTLDAIGHRWGPDSRELHDHILRLDQMVGRLLDSLDTRVGKGRYVVALTGDHGMTPFPTLKSTIYRNGSAKRVSLDAVWRAFLSGLKTAGVDTTALSFDDGTVSVAKSDAFARAGVNADSALADFGRQAMRVQGVARADLLSSLAKMDTTKDVIARRWLHMFSPGGAVRMVITLTQYSYWLTTTYATHGSPYDNDASVPMIFWGARVKPGAYPQMVRTVDLAPTLAAILGVKPTESLDGHVLTQVIKR
jgi:predicted AlkP superfamily pyrophosphatase or phosphodiesterase